MIKLIKSLKVSAGLIFFLISAFIVGTWFRDGFIYGGAEVGLFGYNPERWLEISKYIWWDAVAPGQLIPHFITSVPFYFSFYILNLFGFSAQNIQLVFFFLLLFLMGYGMFLLSLHLLEDSHKKYSLLAGLFYMFNAYTLVQVWHRFLYSTIVLAAVLPLLILFWRKWIKEGKFVHLSIFLLINFLSSYMYGNLASVITVWIALFLVSLAESVFPWQGKFNAGKIGSKFLMGFISWLLTNAWWIMPTFSIAPGLLSKQHSGENNLSTLVVISRQTIMPYLLQFANPFYLFYRLELGAIYSNVIFKLIPWIMSFIIFVGLIVGLRIKNCAKYSVIFIIIVILSKGAASPFSYPYIFGFEHSYFLGVLRNPFEKLGILLPLFGAILFVVGLQAFVKWGVERIGFTVTRLTLILVLVALVGYAWPMFGGRVFGTKELPVKVKIPDSYIQANEWLKQQNQDQGVILHLPFSGKDVVTYTWKQGYHGVDQNEVLFSSLPSLSRVVGIERVDDTLNNLTYIFSPAFAEDKKQILRVMQLLNVKYIVLHKDIKWDDKDTYGDKGVLLEPNSIEKVLDNLDFLQKQNQFGQLVIYKLSNEEYRPTLSFVNNIQIIYPGKSNIMQILSQTKDNGDIVTPLSDEIEPVVSRRAQQILIFPDKKIEYFESSPSAMIEEANEIFNKLLQMNNFFLSLGDLPSQQITKDLIASTAKILQITSPQQAIEYRSLIRKVFDDYTTDLNIHQFFGNLIVDTLRLHLLVLRQIGDTDTAEIIEDNMVRLEMLPKFGNYGQTFKFKVSLEGDWELLLSPQIKEAEIKVNGKVITSKSGIINGKGDFEINYSSPSGTLQDDIVLRSKGTGESTPVPSGEILSFVKISPVSFSGKIRLANETFINFAQTFHPGWKFTLTSEGESFEVKRHFLGNLYGNTWFVDKVGNFNFKIEFTPQKTVSKGAVVAVGTVIMLMLINLYVFWRK